MQGSRYLLETSTVDGYLMEDGLGVLLLDPFAYSQADTVTLSDAVAIQLGKSVADTPSLTDTLVRAVSASRADVLTLPDVIARLVGVFQGDAFTLSDTSIRAVGKQNAVTLVLSDAETAMKINAYPLLDFMEPWSYGFVDIAE